jgi:hypothetical protein
MCELVDEAKRSDSDAPRSSIDFALEHHCMILNDMLSRRRQRTSFNDFMIHFAHQQRHLYFNYSMGTGGGFLVSCQVTLFIFTLKIYEKC